MPVPRRSVRVILRTAEPEDGPTVANLARNAGWRVEGIDWSRIDPLWIIAEIDGLIAGALQVLPGRPMGMLDWLSIESELRARTRGEVVKTLVLGGMATLKRYGSQQVLCIIGDDLPEYQAVIRKRGAVPVLRGATCFTRAL